MEAVMEHLPAILTAAAVLISAIAALVWWKKK
jgi:hypothetical protein